jgi:hypothetical protein
MLPPMEFDFSKDDRGVETPLPVTLVHDATIRMMLKIMDQITIKTPNPKCRLFFKIDQ